MNINVTKKSKVTIEDLRKGDTFTWEDKTDEAFMIIEGEGISDNPQYKHAVNLRTGGVIEPGTACNVLRVAICSVTATVVY